MINTDFDIEQRANQAVEYFLSGYNCAQSVYMAYADLFNISPQNAARTAAPFGAGMGRLREVCGTVTGMFLIVGQAIPCDDPNDSVNRNHNYALVQKLAERFRQENSSIVCRELLESRKRPCADLVKNAAKMIGEELKMM